MNPIKKIAKFIINNLPVPARKFNVQVVNLSPNELLKGRTAFITGGTSGIGFHIAKAFLNSGASVIITGRSMDRIQKAINNLTSDNKYENRIFGLEMDNSKVELFESKINDTLSKIKNKGINQIDILVNNAGVLGAGMPNTTTEAYDYVLDTNLKGVFFLSQLFGKYFKDNNIEANILNIASSSSLRPANSAYTISKWGVRGLTLGLAKSLLPYGITVNGLAPGPTATPMLLKDGNSDISIPSSPFGRYALPEEIANMAVILVSSLGKTIIGDIIYMTGGAGVITFDDLVYKF
ncbi:MAG: SDR family oxidoreductase [Rikenellaceae bacterium]